LNLEDKLHLEGEGNVATKTGEQADSNNGKNLASGLMQVMSEKAWMNGLGLG